MREEELSGLKKTLEGGMEQTSLKWVSWTGKLWALSLAEKDCTKSAVTFSN